MYKFGEPAGAPRTTVQRRLSGVTSQRRGKADATRAEAGRRNCTCPKRSNGSSAQRTVRRVRDYDQYMRDPVNVDCLVNAFGYVPLKSKMAVLIGRDPDRTQYETLIQRLSEIDVQVVTYDMILQTQANQVSFR
jgi:hypothetical protein